MSVHWHVFQLFIKILINAKADQASQYLDKGIIHSLRYSDVMIGTRVIITIRNKLKRYMNTKNLLNLRASHVVPVSPLGHTHVTCPLLNKHAAPFLQGLFGQVTKIKHKKCL